MHGLHDIDYFLLPDRFPESGTKNTPEYECLHKAWKSAHCNTILCQNNFITSTIFGVFFAYLPSNRSASFALKPSYYQSEVWEHFLSDYDAYIVQCTCGTKRYRLYRIHFRTTCWFWAESHRIATVECIGFKTYKRNPNLIWKGIQYVGDPVSCESSKIWLC